ncbi:hypothetical protein O9A_01288 [Bartonella koehlerae C-29]|uniref:Uncharacterized protein n=1 Tax=Bartonella koehlerae C-29 TaxID=1134510 RepID=A0A067W4M0_9HYPH|nr:hypothetical protein O9A_01288 [Bartonella koehlerae C-29]
MIKIKIFLKNVVKKDSLFFSRAFFFLTTTEDYDSFQNML